MMKRKSKQLMSMILTACMLVPTVTAGFVSASAAETEPAAAVGDDQEPSKPPAYDPDTATVGQYTEDQLDTTLLVRHTGKTSELMEESNYARDFVNPDNYATSEEYSEYFHTVTSSEQVYDKLGFSTNQMQSDAKNYAADPDCQNPLSGYSYINPNELLIGDCNRSNDFDTYFHTCENVDAMENIQTNNFDALAKNTSDYFFHDDDGNWNTACSNAIGIDADGDGTDELAYYSIQQKENDNDNLQHGTYIRVQLYDRVPSGGSYVWSMVHEYRMFMQGSNYMYGDLYLVENRGYVTLAAGDYDGDGREELAYYMPDKGDDDDANDARVIIENLDLNGGAWSHSELAKFYLRDFCGTDYDMMDHYFGRDHRLPTVALSTTSTRLGEVVNPNPNTSSAKRYQTYDDLVVSVSIPISDYQLWDIVYPSVTEIFGMKDGSIQMLFGHEYKELTNYNVANHTNPLLTGVNTCDADLNGDGFKEIFVAGYCQYTDFGYYIGFDTGRIGVNIITYNPANNCYEMLWETETILDQQEQAHGTIGGSYGGYIAPPIPLCAGHFMPVKNDLKDQLFINGFIYDLKNTKITGKPLYYSYNSHGVQTNYIPDTLPGYDHENFPVDEVVFEKEHYFGLGELFNKSFSFFDSCAAGRFLNSELDQIVVTSGDYTAWYEDNCWLNISVISYSQSTGDWEVKSHDNYFDERPNHAGGTSLFVTFIDSEQDSAVYRWMGTYCSYSAPALYSILQVPPYYKEANMMYAYNFSLVVGNTEDSAVDWGVGGALDIEAGAGKKVFSAQATLGVDGRFVQNKTWSHDRSLTRSLDLELEEDCAICYVTPVVVNVYEVYQSMPDAAALAASDEAYTTGAETGRLQRDIVQYSMMEEPIFTAVPVTAYNEAVAQQELDGAPDEETKLQPIDVTKLPLTTWGDPVAYDHSLQDAIGESSIDGGSTTAGEVKADVVNDPLIALVDTDIEFGYGTSQEQGLSIDAHVGAHIGVEAGIIKVDVSPSIVGEYATTSGTGSMNGVSFGTSYYPPTAKNQLLGSLQFEADEEAYTDGIPVCHYDAGEGDWYNYSAHSVCYQTNYKGGGTDNVYAHGFYTTFTELTQQVFSYSTPESLNYVFPPEQPQLFAIQSVQKNTDGSLDVKLIWDTVNRNPNRQTDGYNIYMVDANENQLSKLHLQNQEGIITPEPNSHYTTYTVHLGRNDYREENLNFYLAPAYYPGVGNDARAMEGTISLQASITDVDDINKNIIITEQPQPYYMKDDNNDETATFSVEAALSEDFHPTDSTVTFKWHTHNIASDEWETLPVQSVTAPDADGKYRSTCSLEIPGSQKESFKDTAVYCEIRCGNTTQNSDLVILDFIDPTQKHAITLNTIGCGRLTASAQEAAYDETVTLTVTPAELYRVKSVSVNDEALEPVDGVYSFRMPAEDVSVTAEFTNIGHFVGHSLTLDGAIGINYFVTLTDGEFAQGAQLDFAWTVNGVEKTESVTLTADNKTTHGYKATVPVAVAEMTYDVTATLSIGGEAIESNVYSVKQYGDKILTNDYKTEYLKKHPEADYVKLERLVKTMLDYGAKAQMQFKRNTDKLANAGVDYLMTLATADMIDTRPKDMTSGLEEYGLTYAGSTIVYLARTSLRLYYKITDQDKFDAVKDKIIFDGHPATYTEKDGLIYFERKNIAAAELDNTFLLRIDRTTYQYSVLDYVRDCMNAENVPYHTMLLVSATYWYNQAANAYFDQ